MYGFSGYFLRFTYAICNCGLYYVFDWPVRLSVRSSVCPPVSTVQDSLNVRIFRLFFRLTYAICNCGLYYDIDWPVRVSVRPYVRGLLTPFVMLDCIMFSTDLSECQSVRRFTYAICNCGLYYVFD